MFGTKYATFTLFIAYFITLDYFAKLIFINYTRSSEKELEEQPVVFFFYCLIL